MKTVIRHVAKLSSQKALLFGACHRLRAGSPRAVPQDTTGAHRSRCPGSHLRALGAAWRIGKIHLFFYFCRGVGVAGLWCVFLVVFLVSVIWMASTRLSFCLSFCHPFRFSVRSSFRHPFRFSGRFPALLFVSFFVPFSRFAFRPVFRSVSSFRLFRLGVSGGRFVGRAVFVGSLWLAWVCFLSCLCAVAVVWGVSYR